MPLTNYAKKNGGRCLIFFFSQFGKCISGPRRVFTRIDYLHINFSKSNSFFFFWLKPIK